MPLTLSVFILTRTNAGSNLLFQFGLATYFPTTIREKVVLKLISSFFFRPQIDVNRTLN